MALNPISIKQAKISVSFAPNVTWSSADGGDISYEAIKYQDTSENISKTLPGTLSISDKTLKKVHDPINDKELLKAIKNQFENQAVFNVIVVPVKNDIAGTGFEGTTTTYSNCVLLDYMPPKYDRDGSGVATISIKVAVNAMPTYSS